MVPTGTKTNDNLKYIVKIYLNRKGVSGYFNGDKSIIDMKTSIMNSAWKTVNTITSKILIHFAIGHEKLCHLI